MANQWRRVASSKESTEGGMGGTVGRVAESLLAQLMWQVLFSGLVASVEAVTFWQVVINAPPVAIGLAFLVTLALSLAVLQFASRRGPRPGPPHAQDQQVAQAERVTQQQARADGGGTVIQGARDAIGTQYVTHAAPAP